MRVVILGAGGHGRVVAESARLAGFEVMGFIDGDPALLGTRPLGIPVLGQTAEQVSRQIEYAGVLLGVGRNAIRLQLLRRFIADGYQLPVVVHPHGWVSPSATVLAGSVVMANATVQTNCRIGAGVIINTNASVDHDGVIGDGVHVSPGAHLAGGVTVGEGSHIGIGASIIEGRRIGSGCMIAAGAVVIRDVADGERVAGVPAHVMPIRKSL